MLIRPAAAGDAEALTDLHLDVWEQAYGRLIDPQVLRARRRTRTERIERWRTNITQPASNTLLAWRANELIGFVSSGPGRDPVGQGLPELEVWALYVRDTVYGQGVGHALLSAAIGEAAAYLWVLDGNDRAIRFYERQGFGRDGATKTEPVGVERRMVRPGRARPGALPGLPA